jgi:isopentenyl diphosphate isomerase/L-lactate dehydrogenase-like FMN-dependent dehydrogenase
MRSTSKCDTTHSNSEVFESCKCNSRKPKSIINDVNTETTTQEWKGGLPLITEVTGIANHKTIGNNKNEAAYHKDNYYSLIRNLVRFESLVNRHYKAA